MLIGIDANEANLTQNRVGVNQYAFYLIRALHDLNTDHEFIIYLKNLPLPDLPKERSNWHYRVIPFPKLWTQTRLPWDLYTHSPRPDVFFSATHYAPRFSPVPTIVAIMDLGFLDHPDQFTAKDYNQLKNWTSYSVKNASKIIAISESTKSEVMKFYNRKPQDIIVTPLSYDKKLYKPTQDKSILSKYGITKPYFYFLGSLKPSKNISGLIHAFNKFSGYQLIISGKKAWLYDEIFDQVSKLNLKDRIVFTGFVPEDDIPALMSQSQAFILPSFHEGFGIPVLEAMACGTPVIVSQTASLPEVAGSAGIYIKPTDPDSIAAGLKTAIKYRSKYIKLGLERVKSFDWSKTARETLNVLTHV